LKQKYSGAKTSFKSFGKVQTIIADRVKLFMVFYLCFLSWKIRVYRALSFILKETNWLECIEFIVTLITSIGCCLLGKVLMATQENHVPYDRPKLSKVWFYIIL